MFRKKLIEEFRLMENGLDVGSKNLPQYATSELKLGSAYREKAKRAEGEKAEGLSEEGGQVTLAGLLRENPMQLVRFKIMKRTTKEAKERRMLDKAKRILNKRLVRVRNLNTVTLPVWANWLVYHKIFGYLIIGVIFFNAITLGVQAELSAKEEVYWSQLQLLRVLDWMVLILFGLEIALKLVDDFNRFWLDPWNLFDFTVTALSVVPEIIQSLPSARDSSQSLKVAKHLRVFRTFRSLKMVTRFPSLRVIVHTILQAFESFSYIFLLLLLVFYIFAVFAMNLFEDYTLSTSPGLSYQNKFGDLGSSFMTLFQLLTLDQWYNICTEVAAHTIAPLTVMFFITWVWIGAFVFRNIFIGVMVKNFRQLSTDIKKQDADKKKNKMANKAVKLFQKELQIRERRSVAAPAAVPTTQPTPCPPSSQSQPSPAQTASSDAHSTPQPPTQQHGGGGLRKTTSLASCPSGLKRPPSQRVNFDLSTGASYTSVFDARPKASADDPASFLSTPSVNPTDSQNNPSILLQGQPSDVVWENLVSQTMLSLSSSKDDTYWPRDTLFLYLQTMENLQENIQEYQELHQLAAWSLFDMHDT